METKYDIIYDRIADSQYNEISRTLREYSKNRLSAQKAIERIKWKKDDGDQYCFKTERSLSLLTQDKIIVQQRIENKWVQKEFR